MDAELTYSHIWQNTMNTCAAVRLFSWIIASGAQTDSIFQTMMFFLSFYDVFWCWDQSLRPYTENRNMEAQELW